MDKPPDLYLSEAESESLRQLILTHFVEPEVRKAFLDKDCTAAVLHVAQYWNDEADDAVHGQLLLIYPDGPQNIAEYKDPYLEDWDDSAPDPPPRQCCKEVDLDCNFRAIPAFAAYCKEGADQEMDYSDAYVPYAVFTRKDPPEGGSGNEFEIEIVGEQLRPWLNGIYPQWDCEEMRTKLLELPNPDHYSTAAPLHTGVGSGIFSWLRKLSTVFSGKPK